MKLTVLTENTACRDNLKAEHGLSLYLEAAGKKVLLDMGQTDAFVRNAEKLGIDLSQVDMAILSHGHYDHGGGLKAFLRINGKAPVYVHETAFGQHYNGGEMYIGLQAALQNHPRLIPVAGSMSIAPNVWLHDCNHLDWQFESWGLNKKSEDSFAPDDFRHEMYLQITEGEKRILLTGCSHKGICNIVRHFQPDVLVGGFHLNKQEDPQALHSIAIELLKSCGLCYTGHCTGEKQYRYLKEVMGLRLQPLSTGATIQI